MLPKLRAFTTPFILLMCHANISPSGRVLRAAFPDLSRAADDSLELIMLILAVDPGVSVFMFLGVMTTLQSFPCTDASGWEICPKNPSPGTLGGFFLHPDVRKSFAFALPWATLLQCFPLDFQEKHALLHINYLEFSAAWILLVWLVLAFPKLIRHKRIVLKLDSQVAIAWILNGRCSTFPFYRLMQFVAFLEWKYQFIVLPVYVPSQKNPADKLTRIRAHDPKVIKVNRSPISITKVPSHVIRIFVEVLTGVFDYKKFFISAFSKIRYDRRLRFTKTPMVHKFLNILEIPQYSFFFWDFPQYSLFLFTV